MSLMVMGESLNVECSYTANQRARTCIRLKKAAVRYRVSIATRPKSSALSSYRMHLLPVSREFIVALSQIALHLWRL